MITPNQAHPFLAAVDPVRLTLHERSASNAAVSLPVSLAHTFEKHVYVPLVIPPVYNLSVQALCCDYDLDQVNYDFDYQCLDSTTELDSSNGEGSYPLLTQSSEEGLPKEQSVSTQDVNELLVSDISPLGQNLDVYGDCAKGTCVCAFYIGEVKSQLRPCRFASFILDETLDLREKYLDLLWHVTDGFPIVDSPVDPYECENYLSITCEENKARMDHIIERELKEGMVSMVVQKPTCIHALGAVPKSSGGIRQITDCSRPFGRSVNFHCDSILKDFCFKNVEYVVPLLNAGDFLTVVDIKAAYRAVPIREAHKTYQGFSWDIDGVKKWFVDNRMCFGLRLGPMFFNYISNFIFDVLTIKGLKIVNYFDDFLAVASDFATCMNVQRELTTLLRFLGFHVSFDKLVHPATTVTYLGIEIDSVEMEFRLPEGKLSKLMELLDLVLKRKRISKKELESLGGSLSHCAHVVRGGKVFCKGVYSLYKILVQSNRKFINIPDWVRSDLLWWRKLCTTFNGRSKLVKDQHPSPMISDASFKGFGVFFGSDWCAGTWCNDDHILLSSSCNHIVSKPLYDDVKFDNINVLEFWPVLVGVKRWAHILRDKSVVVYTDNTQVMFMLLNGRSSNVTCMRWIRELFWICAFHNIEIIPKYISTEENVVADTLSRIPYAQVASKLEKLLYNSNLCCLNLLFENYRGPPARPEQTG